MVEVKRRGRPPSESYSSSQKGAQALERGIIILQYLAKSGGSASVSDISEKLNLPLSSTFRLLKVLEQADFVYQDDQLSWWHIGLQAFTVGSSYIHNRDVLSVAVPHMQRLTLLSGETSNLAIRNGFDAVLISQRECQSMVRMCAPLGSRLPLHASGAGKALIYSLDDAALISLIVQSGLKNFTSRTLCDINELQKDLLQAKNRGYALDQEEHVVGLNCLASAVFDNQGSVIAAISISGPSTRVTPERFTDLGELVHSTSQNISQALGQRPAT